MARPPAIPTDSDETFAPVGADMVVVAAVGAPFGVKGWSHVHSFTDPPDNLLNYAPLYLRTERGWRALPKLALRRHQQGFVGLVSAVADRDAARGLTKSELAVLAADLPAADLDEYYWRDLIGLEVRDTAGTSLGRVKGLLETGAHDVLRVQPAGDAEEVLVPFVAAYVHTVDLATGTITVDWQGDW